MAIVENRNNFLIFYRLLLIFPFNSKLALFFRKRLAASVEFVWKYNEKFIKAEIYGYIPKRCILLQIGLCVSISLFGCFFWCVCMV